MSNYFSSTPIDHDVYVLTGSQNINEIVALFDVIQLLALDGYRVMIDGLHMVFEKGDHTISFGSDGEGVGGIVITDRGLSGHRTSTSYGSTESDCETFLQALQLSVGQWSGTVISRTFVGFHPYQYEGVERRASSRRTGLLNLGLFVNEYYIEIEYHREVLKPIDPPGFGFIITAWDSNEEREYVIARCDLIERDVTPALDEEVEAAIKHLAT